MKASLHYLALVVFLSFATVVQAQISGSINVPGLQYPTLDSAIKAINSQGVGTAGATINFTANTNETAPVGGYKLGSATLNASLSASAPLVINGNGNTITGFSGTSVSNDAIFSILGADYVTINALNLQEAGTNTTPTTKMEWGFVLCKLSNIAPYDGCQHNVIKNCNITLDGSYGQTVGIYAKHTLFNSNTSLSYSGVTTASANSYNQFLGNTISGVTRGIYLSGIVVKGYYDVANEIGGATPASGNTITVGGSTNICYAVSTVYDSIISLRYNHFSIANSPRIGDVYFFLPFTGTGNLTFTHNYMDITSSATNSSISCFYNSQQHKDPNASLSQLTSTHDISDNTITGSFLLSNSNTLLGFYESNISTKNKLIERNSLLNIDMGNSVGQFYGVYSSNVIATDLRVNNNKVYNFSKLGTAGTSYGIYVDARPAQTGPCQVSHNTVRKIRSNYDCYNYYIYGSTASPLPYYPSSKLFSAYNVLDSVDLSTAFNVRCYNNMGLFGGDSSLVAYDTITNILLPKNTKSYVYNYVGSGDYATSNYVSKGHYIAHIKSGSGAHTINNYIGEYTTHADSIVIEDLNIVGSASAVSTLFGYHARGDVANNICRNWNLTAGASAVFNIGGFGATRIRNNTFKNIKITGTGDFTMTTIGPSTSKFEFDHNTWDNISVDSGYLQAGSFNCNINDYSVHDNVMTNIFVGDAMATKFYELVGAYGTTEFYNNILSNVFLRSGYNNSNLVGLNLQGPGLYKVYNNTIKIDSTAPVGSNFSFSGIAYDTLAQLDLRNNIININLKPGSAGYVAALRRGHGITGKSPQNFLQTSDGNIFFAPNVSNSWLYAEGASASALVNKYNLTNDPGINTPCSNLKDFLGHDKHSFTENNLAAATLQGTFAPIGLSFAKKGAVPTSSPQDLNDLANVVRPSLFDVGALQFSGTAIDSAGPIITITSYQPSGYCLGCGSVIATITDASGVDTSIVNRPRLYYKKSTDANAFAGNTSTNNGWKFVTPTTIHGNSYTFYINCSLFRSALSYGDSVSYFIVAQDSSTSPRVSATSASFAICPNSVSLSSIHAPVKSNPVLNGFRIFATPQFALSSFPAAVCQSGSTTLTVQPKPLGATVQWQSAAPGSSFTAITGATADTFYTGIITTSRLYRALIYCGTSVLDTTNVDTFIVAHPSLSAVKGDTLCGIGKANLIAVASVSSFPKWYAAASGGNSIFIGDTFSTPNISSTTTYFVTASTPKASNYSLGLTPPGFSSNTMGSYGLEFVFHNKMTDFYSTTVYPNGSGTFTVELTDMQNGLRALDIYGLPIPQRTFHVSGSGGVSSPNILNLNWHDISPGDYSLNVVPGSYPAGLLLSYQYLYPTLPYPYSTPTTCVDIVGPTQNSSVYPYPYNYFFFYDNVFSCDCDSSARIPVTAVVTPAPAIKISNPAYPGICLGQSTILSVSSSNSTYAYTWTPGAITSSSLTVSPTVSTTYHVTAKDPGTGCTAIDSAIINVNSVPPAPSISPNHPTICAGSPVALKASLAAGRVNWLNVSKLFKDSLLSTPLSTTDTNSKVFAAPDSTTIYTAISNAQGCLSLPSAPDTVFVNPLPNATFVVVGSDTICAGGHSTFCLPPSPVHTYQWYFYSNFITSGTSNCYTITVPGRYKAIVRDITTGCTNVSSDAVITVLPAPTISITSLNPTSFCKGGTDTLVATGTGIASFQWARNGTNIAGATTSNYVATTTGTYTCIATNASGCTTISNSIAVDVVAPNVTVTPQGSLSVCSGGTVTLQAVSASGLSFIWYNAGAPIPGALLSAYTATTSGNYYVKIVDASTGCSDTSKHFNVVIGAPPSTIISPASISGICSGDSVVLHAVSAPGLAYQWKKGSTIISIGGNDSNYTVKTAGSYTVVVSITATPACKDSSATATVVTVNALPLAGISATGATIICGGDSVVMATTAATGIAYQWNLNNVAITTGATGARFAAKFNGSYTLMATNNATGCVAISNAIVVTVNPAPPIAVLPAGSIRICQGDTVTLRSNLNRFFYLAWNKNGLPVVPADSNDTYIVRSSGLYSVTAIDSLTGCSATSVATALKLDSLPIAATTPTGTSAICQSTPITLKSATRDTTVLYQWTLNGSKIIGARADSLNTNLPGSYVLVLSSKASGCVDSSAAITLNVTVPPMAVITPPVKTRVCAGDTVNLNANTGTGLSYQWRFHGSVVIGATSSSFKAFLPGSYTVSVNNGPLCTSLSNAIAVKIDTLPPAFIVFNSSPEFCEGDSVMLIANPGAGYRYDWRINTLRIGDTSAQYLAKSSSAYTVQVTNSTGCANISASVNVVVHPTPVPTIVRSGSTLQTTTSYVRYQWFLNNVLIPGATGSSYTYSAAGTYKVEVVDTYGCEGYSNQFYLPTGVLPTAIGSSISVYPNPTTDILKIEASVAIKVVLRDAVGRTILEAANVKEIDLGHVANGAYLLYISDMKGSLLKVEKVLKGTNH